MRARLLLTGTISGFSPLTLWFLMAWTIFATIVLKQVWQRVPVPERRGESRFRVRPGVVAGTVALLVGAALASSAYLSRSPFERFFLIAMVVMVPVGALLAW